MELWHCESPDNLRQQCEQSGEYVGNTKVEQEEMHSGDLAVLGEYEKHDEEVTDKDEEGHEAEYPNLETLITLRNIRADAGVVK